MPVEHHSGEINENDENIRCNKENIIIMFLLTLTGVYTIYLGDWIHRLILISLPQCIFVFLECI